MHRKIEQAVATAQNLTYPHFQSAINRVYNTTEAGGVRHDPQRFIVGKTVVVNHFNIETWSSRIS